MSGEELYQKLSALTPEERKSLKVYKTWWVDGEEDCSGWENESEIDTFHLQHVQYFNRGKYSSRLAIVLT